MKMKDKFKEEALTKAAMGIILESASAINTIAEAYEKALLKEFDEAEVLMKVADTHITNAHKSQTEIIQRDTSGDTYDLTLLFVHAQDTLMTTKTEYTVTLRIIQALKAVFS